MTCQDESFNKDLKKLHYCVFVELFLSVEAAFLPCGDVTLAGSSQLSTPELHTKVGKKTAKTRCCTSAAAATAPPHTPPSPGAVSSTRCLEAPSVGVRVRVQVGVRVGVGVGSGSRSGLAPVSSCRAEHHQADRRLVWRSRFLGVERSHTFTRVNKHTREVLTSMEELQLAVVVRTV